MMISYAQNAEDVLLDRLFPRDYRGFYVDVGANHPTYHSVTRHFYDLGWNGVNVEPSPPVFAMLPEARPRDINLNLGLSDREGVLAFFEATTSLGMSTFSRDFASGLVRDGFPVRETTVPVLTLATVCDRYASETIDFLKIDVESHEAEVIAGGDWRRHRARVVLVESTGGFEWESVLLSADYLLAAFDGLNRYYVRAEDRDWLPKLAAPANYLDQFVYFEHEQALRDARWERDHFRDQLGEEKARTADLERRLASVEGLGANSIAFARKVRRVSGAIRSLWKAG